MSALTGKSGIVQALQQEILSLQGFKPASVNQRLSTGLSSIETAFPNQTFPTGAVHEFLSYAPAQAAATNGFMTGLLGQFMQHQGACLWIGKQRTIFPSALKRFGIDPERIIFVDLTREKEVLWTVEQALKCAALAAVIGELSELTFTESRRLQLAVEESQVTGFIHRYSPRRENTTACVTRWKIAPLPSELEDGLPGVGYPRWQVDLLKVRNGKPGNWQLEWNNNGFRHIAVQTSRSFTATMRKTG